MKIKESNLPEKMLIFVAEASLNTIQLSQHMALIAANNMVKLATYKHLQIYMPQH